MPLYRSTRVMKIQPGKILNLYVPITQINSQTIPKTRCIEGYMLGSGLIYKLIYISCDLGLLSNKK